MRNILAVCKRELKTYFTSPIAYVVLGIFLVLAGYLFYSHLAIYSLRSFQAMSDPHSETALSVTEWVTRPLFDNLGILLLFMMPMLTMRLFAEEKKTGTIELLMTFPIKDLEVLLGKFSACLLVLLVMLSPTFLYMLILAYFGSVEWGPVFTGYLGLFLLGSAFMAMGILFSSLTENQIVAAVLSFGALIIFWVLGWAADYSGATAAAVLGHLSVLEHVESFSKGVLDLKDTVYYLTFIGFCLFLAIQSLESWKWRG